MTTALLNSSRRKAGEIDAKNLLSEDALHVYDFLNPFYIIKIGGNDYNIESCIGDFVHLTMIEIENLLLSLLEE